MTSLIPSFWAVLEHTPPPPKQQNIAHSNVSEVTIFDVNWMDAWATNGDVLSRAVLFTLALGTTTFLISLDINGLYNPFEINTEV